MRSVTWAMEATGIYWKPVWHLLEEQFELVLANAQHIRNVPGRKTDVNDATWIADLLAHGLIRASFVPLVRAHVALIEQPFPVGHEALLDGFQSPIKIAADESVQGVADLPGLARRFNVINIKLDKAGGLTEALVMARTSHEMGLETMVGNMFGTSLAMAPAFLVGQICEVVDLDGPVFLASDRAEAAEFQGGLIMCSEQTWGGALCELRQTSRRQVTCITPWLDRLAAALRAYAFRCDAGHPSVARCTRHSTFECFVTRGFSDLFLSWLKRTPRWNLWPPFDGRPPTQATPQWVAPVPLTL
jgi:hypothetical protein